jgi:hypothetical protein
MFLIQADGQLVEMSEKPYDSEKLLQDILPKYPSLLAGVQINDTDPRKWLLISREAALASEENGSSRWSVDHLFWRPRRGLKEASLGELQKLLLCQATGGPCFYLGRDMKTVHTGMEIDKADWQAMVANTMGVLNSLKVPEADQNAVLEMLSGKKNDIVEGT